MFNTELSTIPLCAERLETGELKNPRVEPKPEFNILLMNTVLSIHNYFYTTCLT